MWTHFIHLLVRSLDNMPAIVSSNWAAVGLAFGIFALSQLLNFLARGWDYMKRQWRESLGIGVVAVALGWICLYAWSVVRAVYQDHERLVTENRNVRASTANFVDPKSKDARITELEIENKNLKATIRDRESPEVRIFPVPHQETRGDVTRMEYVLTTSKMRTPVEITTSCDFPVADFHIGFLTTTGGYSSTTNKNKISSTSYQFVIQSPTWTPTMPIHATVEFERALDSRPTCRFLVQ